MENKIILFNIASRSRPEKCVRLVEQILDYCYFKPYKVLVKLDTDDPAFATYMVRLTDTQELCENLIFRVGSSANKIHAINRDIPLNEPWDIIVDVSDDFVFTMMGFDQLIREQCGPDDFLLFPEPFADSQAVKGKNERIAIMLCMGRKYYERDGYLFNPVYKSLFCDNEATEVARLRGCLKEVDENIFYHAHPAAGYGKADEQTKRTEAFWNEDKATYLARKQINFGL